MTKQRLSNKEKLEKDILLNYFFGADTSDIKKLAKFFQDIPQFKLNVIQDDGVKDENKNETHTKTNDIQNIKKYSKEEMQFQKGDEVLIVNTPEGITNVKGVIVDEVKATEQYLVQLSKLNAMYVDKSNLQIIKRKQDVEEINQLKEKINKFKANKNELITDVQYITGQINDLAQHKEEKQQQLRQITEQSEQLKQELERLEGR